MKYYLPLRLPGIPAMVSIGTAIAFFAATSICHAETGAKSSPMSPVPGLFIDTPERPSAKPEDSATGWQTPPPDKHPAGKQPQPEQSDQAEAPQGWASPAQGSESGYGSCKYATPEDEDFFCKMVRILYGPDTPRGPNRDVDDNISAGGAGG